MLVAIAVFRDSGALNLLKDLSESGPELVSLPVGSSSDGTDSATERQRFNRRLTDLVKQLGPDNILSYMAATIYGSAETTFYVVAVYFGSVGVTKTRHAIPAGLFADFVGVIASVLACRLLFR